MRRTIPLTLKPFSAVSTAEIRAFTLIVMVGLVTRLLALPWAETVNGDALSRIHLASDWANSPHWISADIWAPFHTYVLGVGLWLMPWPFVTPVLLNVLFSIGTAICLWRFTRSEFGVPAGSEAAPQFVAIAFLLLPLVFRNSLMALSEPLYLFLMSLMLVFLAQARRISGGLGQAALAGLFLTLAAAVRYEVWPLIPVLALLLWRKPKSAFAFGMVALAFPISWMASSHLQYGDPLYVLNFQAEDTADVLALYGGMTPTRWLVRLVFFPMTLFFGMTAGVLGLSLLGVWHGFRQRVVSLVWLAPFGVLLAMLFYKSVGGTLNLDVRYSLALALFLLPYSAVGLQGLRSERPWLRRLILLSIVPLGYVLYLATPLTSPLLKGISRSPADEVAPIPRLSPSTRSLIDLVGRHRRDEALMVWGFGANQVDLQVIFHHRLMGPEQLTVSHSLLPNQQETLQREFFSNHPKGLILAEMAEHPELPLPDASPIVIRFDQFLLELSPVATDGSGCLFRYRRRSVLPRP